MTIERLFLVFLLSCATCGHALIIEYEELAGPGQRRLYLLADHNRVGDLQEVRQQSRILRRFLRRFELSTDLGKKELMHECPLGSSLRDNGQAKWSATDIERVERLEDMRYTCTGNGLWLMGAERKKLRQCSANITLSVSGVGTNSFGALYNLISGMKDTIVRNIDPRGPLVFPKAHETTANDANASLKEFLQGVSHSHWFHRNQRHFSQSDLGKFEAVESVLELEKQLKAWRDLVASTDDDKLFGYARTSAHESRGINTLVDMIALQSIIGSDANAIVLFAGQAHTTIISRILSVLFGYHSVLKAGIPIEHDQFIVDEGNDTYRFTESGLDCLNTVHQCFNQAFPLPKPDLKRKWQRNPDGRLKRIRARQKD